MILITFNIKLTQVYSRYLCEKPLMERVFVRIGYGLIKMKHRSNYDWMLFLTSPMAFVWARTELRVTKCSSFGVLGFRVGRLKFPT